MKKFISLCLAAVLSLSTAAVSYAKPGDAPKPGGANKADFYISRWGVQWDSDGDVKTRDTSHFSSAVGTSKLNTALRPNFKVVIGTKATEEDVLSYVKTVPEDADVFAALEDEFSDADIYTSKGKRIAWEDFTPDEYKTEWYVLKKELDGWHIDGRLVEIETNENVNIVLPEEKDEFTDLVGPEEAPKDDEFFEEPEIPEVKPDKDKEKEEPKDKDEDKSINLKGATYAYIFGYEPIITENYDENGNLFTTAQIEMGMDDAVTVEQVSSMLMRMLDQSGNTTDVDYPVTAAVEPHRGQWYERGLAYLCSVGGFDKNEPIEIKPISRGQVAKLVACALKLNLTAKTPFADIEGNEYKKYIEMVHKYEYMHGVSDTAFNPDGIMTRAEFCALFNNIIDRNSLGLIALDEDGNEQQVTAETYYFIDMDPGHWAYEICLKASSAYDEDGYVDLAARLANIRNKLDQYDSQKQY